MRAGLLFGVRELAPALAEDGVITNSGGEPPHSKTAVTDRRYSDHNRKKGVAKSGFSR